MGAERDIRKPARKPGRPTRRVFPGPDTGPRDDAHAVVIGIDHYADPRIPNLMYARADAEAVYDVLVDRRYGRFRKENVTLLVDEEATQKRIRSVIGTQLPRRAAKDHTVCLYFAGHGAPVVDPRTNSRDGLEKYLVPHDAEAEDLRATGIPMNEVQQFFEWIDTDQLIFFIDSCYSGGAGGLSGRSFQHSELNMRATMTDDFLESISGEGRMIVTACGTNEVSLESPGLQHGVFTYHLIEGLKGAADVGRDGLVTLDELYEYVYRNVESQARGMGGSMNPIRKGFVQGTVYLSCYETDEQVRARELGPAAEAALESGALDEAERLWREIVALTPDDEHAADRLAAIVERRAEAERQRAMQERRRVEILHGKQRVLLEHRRTGALPGPLYAQAMELVERDPSTLDDTEKLIYELIDELSAGHLTPALYVRSVELAGSDAPAVESLPAAPEMWPPAPETMPATPLETTPAAPETMPAAPEMTAGDSPPQTARDDSATTTPASAGDPGPDPAVVAVSLPAETIRDAPTRPNRKRTIAIAAVTLVLMTWIGYALSNSTDRSLDSGPPVATDENSTPEVPVPADSWVEVGALRGHTGAVDDVSFSPDGRMILSTSQLDTTARVWSMPGQGEPVVFRHSAIFWGSASLSPDGRKVVTAADDYARVWNVDGRGTPVVIRPESYYYHVYDAAFSPDGSKLLTVTDDYVRIWNANGRGSPIVLRYEGLNGGRFYAASYSPDGSRIVATSFDNTAVIWNANGQGDPTVLRGHRGQVVHVAFSPDGSKIVTASRDSTARVWNANGQGQPVVLSGHTSEVRAASFSPDGSKIATTGYGSIRIWNADGVGDPVVLPDAGDRTVFSPDGTKIVTSDFRTARVWNTDGRGDPVVMNPGGPAAFSPDGFTIRDGGI